MEIQCGTRLKNRYEILDLLGEGGFGNTYKAIDHLLNRFVAIKCSESSLAHEANILKAIMDIPHIAGFYDYFMVDKTHFLVMRLVKGKSLEDLRKENGGTLHAKTLCKMLPSVIIALDQMHDLGIIHRDISPGNLILTEDDTLYLIDFGAATSLRESKLKNHLLIRHKGLDSPEFNNASKQGPWTDIYSLCSTIVYLLCGEGVAAAADREAYDYVPSMLVGLSLSAKMQNALIRGLSLEVKFRYDSVTDFGRDFLGREKSESMEEEYRVHYHAKTFIGSRNINQDNFMVDTLFAYAGEDCEIKGYIECSAGDYHIAAIADGVSRSMHSELASKAAIQAISHFIDYYKYDSGLAENLVEELLDQLNEKIQTLSNKIGKTATTVALMLWKGDRYCVANIGDSPIYQLSGGKLQKLSVDHTMARQKIDAGQNVTSADFNALSGYLGKRNMAGSQMACIKTGRISQGDIFLLCSDGVSREMSEQKLGRLIKKDGDRAMKKLYDKCNQNPHIDNCTAIILKF